SKGEQVQQVVFAISLRKDGSTYVNGKPVQSDDALRELARSEHALHPDMSTVIQADGDVPHRRIIRVMDVLSQADVTRIAFGVDVDRALEEGAAP
ncbi:MAG: biopolymer transporter ExbD, partial [Myxococcaceae bacterium]|nr:biopolymer transporter ExbD [Myxococcaceae bacterium]